MGYEKKTWKNRQSEYPNRRTLTPVDGQENTYDVSRAEGLVMEDGDAFDQESMNDLEERIGNGFVENGVNVYIHTKSGTVHEFTGQGANGRAKMTANVSEGDTFTLNGAPVTAYMGSSIASETMHGQEWSGKWISFVAGDGVLSFAGGGGIKMDLLWENTSPAKTPFAAQKVSLDLSKYDFVFIVFGVVSTDPYNNDTSGFYSKKSTNSRVNAFTSSTDGKQIIMYFREFSMDDTGVTFKSGYGSQITSGVSFSENNLVGVPIKIYGVNGL